MLFRSGVLALRAVGRKPTGWHINEGDAAYLILERIREGGSAGLRFDVAREAIAAETVFTTHTPVPAGHDIFQHTQMRWFLSRLLAHFDVEESVLLALGADDHGGERFNMTTLALRGSRRSEEHTSELQSLMRISYAVFCLKKKKLTTK